jgi:hypothetical protein
MTITWSIRSGSPSKNCFSAAASLASKAAVLRASTSSAARLSRSGFRPVRITSAPSARARRVVSSPMPALPPITTTVCPRSSGSGWVGREVASVVMTPSVDGVDDGSR